jgi:predicted MFS family arabinose efflux permease
VRRDFELLRGRDFRRLFVSRTFSVFGSSLAPIALAFGVLALPGASASSLSIVMLAAALPPVLLTLLGGVLADRVRRARVVTMAEALGAAAELAGGLLFLTGHATVPLLAVAAALGGSAIALLMPALTGIVPEVSPPDQLQSANALLRLTTNVARILGTALGGVLVALVGSGWTLVIAGCFFAVAALLASRVRGNTPEGPGSSRVFEDLREGWHEFVSRRWVWVIVLVFSFVNMAYSATMGVLGPVQANAALGGPGPWAFILALESVGTVVGVLIALRLHPRRPMYLCMLGALIFCVPIALLAVPTPVWTIAAVGLLAGIAGDVFGVLWDTALQQHVPAESLSRVSSYDWMGSSLLAPLGLAVAGPLADAIGVGPALWACFVLAAVPIVLGLLDPQVRGVRALDPLPTG